MNTYRTAVAVVCAGLAWCSVGWAGVYTGGSILDEGPGGVLYVAYDNDGSLRIDAGSDLNRLDTYVGHGAGYTGTATVTGSGSTLDSRLRVGNEGSGILNILDGGEVSGVATLGYYPDSTGTATVSGTGSMWNGVFYVGREGSGTLNILDGGRVSNPLVAYVASQNTSTGAANVSGAGSTWAIDGPLYVGRSFPGNARGTLTVSDGGQVTADQFLLDNTHALVNLHVSGDDMLVLGDAGTVGNVTNSGTIRFYADPLLPVGVYRPISEFAGRAMSWSGSGAYKAFGGAWNAGNKTFNISATTLLDTGTVETVSSGERLLFTDPGSGDSVGASFGAVPGGTTFSASLLSPAELADLVAMPEVEGQVLAGLGLYHHPHGRRRGAQL